MVCLLNILTVISLSSSCILPFLHSVKSCLSFLPFPLQNTITPSFFIHWSKVSRKQATFLRTECKQPAQIRSVPFLYFARLMMTRCCTWQGHGVLCRCHTGSGLRKGRSDSPRPPWHLLYGKGAMYSIRDTTTDKKPPGGSLHMWRCGQWQTPREIFFFSKLTFITRNFHAQKNIECLIQMFLVHIILIYK